MSALPELPEGMFFRVKDIIRNSRGDSSLYVLLMRKRRRWFPKELCRRRAFYSGSPISGYEDTPRAVAQTAATLYNEHRDRVKYYTQRAALIGDYPPKTL